MGGYGKGKGNSGKGNGIQNAWQCSQNREQWCQEGPQTLELGNWQQDHQAVVHDRRSRRICKGTGRGGARTRQLQKGQGKGCTRDGSRGAFVSEGRAPIAQLLFVKNLPGDIDAEALEDVFANYGQVLKVYVMSGRSASVRACAFVKYVTDCDADLAVQALHGQLEMQPGHGPIAVQANAPGVFVNNLPRDVQEEIVDYVFSFYGQVQTVHITTRLSRQGRACAFIEYSSVAEVEQARAALNESRELCAGSRFSSDTIDFTVSEEKTDSPSETGIRPCVVCLGAAQTHAFVPCGHRCVCAECGMTIVGQDLAACPLCRTAVEQVLRIFF